MINKRMWRESTDEEENSGSIDSRFGFYMS